MVALGRLRVVAIQQLGEQGMQLLPFGGVQSREQIVLDGVGVLLQLVEVLPATLGGGDDVRRRSPVGSAISLLPDLKGLRRQSRHCGSDPGGGPARPDRAARTPPTPAGQGRLCGISAASADGSAERQGPRSR